jgi:MFS family permease
VPEPDLERFTALYEEHLPRVWAYAVARAGRQHAEEVVGETFAIAWRRRGAIPAPARRGARRPGHGSRACDRVPDDPPGRLDRRRAARRPLTSPGGGRPGRAPTMAPVTSALRPMRLAAVLAFGASLTLVSNALEPAVLGHQVLRLAPGAPSTALGLTTFAGLLVAIVVQPVVGALSDGTRGPWGRRLPYLAAGTAGLVASLLLVASAPTLAILLGALLASQLTANVVQAPSQALIPDHVSPDRRGRVAGMKAALDIVAFVTGRLVAGILVGLAPRWGEAAALAAVGVPIAVLLAALAVTAAGAREPAASGPAPSPLAALRSAFRIDLRGHPAFGWWFANRLLFWTGFLLLNTFLLLFVIAVLGRTEPEAQRLVGQVSAALGGLLAVAALAAGWLSDRVGRRPLLVAAGLVSAAGTAVVLGGRDTAPVLAGAAVIGLGVGMFLSANWALITDIVPGAEAARYLGVANVATAGGSAIARLLGGVLIDPVNRALGSPSAGYLLVYAIALACFLLATLAALGLPQRSAGTTRRV